MEVLIRGVLFGLLLAVMLGPIFIVIINTSLQYGKKAGIIASLGVWFSDLLYISVSYFFINQVADLVNNARFRFWMAIIGGFILLSFGIYNLFKKVQFKQEDIVGDNEIDQQDEVDNTAAFAQNMKRKSLKEVFLSGFLVNTVNPFTLFFWLTVMTTEVVGNELSESQAIFFIGGIVATIILTDILKVFAAAFIRSKINLKIFTWFVRIAGIGLAGFGMYFLYYGISL